MWPRLWVVVSEVPRHPLLAPARLQQLAVEPNLPLAVVALLLERPVERNSMSVALRLNERSVTVTEQHPLCPHGHRRRGRGRLALLQLLEGLRSQSRPFVEEASETQDTPLGLRRIVPELGGVHIGGIAVLVLVTRLCAESVLVPRPAGGAERHSRALGTAPATSGHQQAAESHGRHGLLRRSQAGVSSLCAQRGDGHGRGGDADAKHMGGWRCECHPTLRGGAAKEGEHVARAGRRNEALS
mmetsp:Transcript_55178/g.124259  ORF Transcript_55178/g.124259 Transcript_55178/m.124259 type:complete len:242 (-) Transcript_55178:8-733(-)